MEHEVFVPVPAERLKEALADPARVAGAVPGLQQEAGAEPVTGRLKVRVGSHSVTYRGTVRLTARDDGAYGVEGEAAEARGTGTAALALTVRIAGAEGGATLTFTGTATADGRLGDLPPDAVSAAVTRLLTRFAENLGRAADDRDEPETAEPTDAARAGDAAGTADAVRTADADGTADAVRSADAEDVNDVNDAEDSAKTARSADADGSADPARSVDADGSADPARSTDADGSADPARTTDADGSADPARTANPTNTTDGADATQRTDPAQTANPADAAEPPADAPPSVFETEVPPPSLDRGADEQGGAAAEPPAEAAHARRTMIGRSAEEVDHAPPRGRYAPVPAPEAVTAGTPLRWAAPAAALVVASAIVVGRALRRRR
ncbi:SRPBCC family protein [Streptomyces griseoviridis]|uniref:Carbon monoxide dehydrogenase subunit G n=1 Tax=Streptomyces griseoviridis TaxID=45398 RepID=A0ABT9LHH9_STRGD|nr:SRPBCC domain-containing protein [Streptomyces griseoviridis]MDP9683143.1 carbon monoxide dehydrogenase subunit G [Streptomyces griseoviridis]GGT14211.1 hypothetical protein GCM10010240_54350 [Streptomyces griseoviridis]